MAQKSLIALMCAFVLLGGFTLFSIENDPLMPFYDYDNTPVVLVVRYVSIVADFLAATIIALHLFEKIRQRLFWCFVSFLTIIACVAAVLEGFIAQRLCDNYDKYPQLALANGGVVGGIVMTLLWVCVIFHSYFKKSEL